MTKRYGYKGTNNDAETCDICGRTELKKVMWLVELDPDGGEIGQPIACGTSCGATMLGYTQNEFSKKTNEASKEISRLERIARRNHPDLIEASEIKKVYFSANARQTWRQSAEYKEARKLISKANEELNKMSFAASI